MSPEDFILDSHKVTGRFGKWPDFHDAEIISLHLHRTGEWGPTLEFTLFGWGWNGVVLPSGFYDRPNLSLIRFRCDGIEEDNELAGFNHQNVLNGLYFNKAGDLIEVVLSSIHGVGGKFACRSVAIVDVVESTEDGRPVIG